MAYQHQPQPQREFLWNIFQSFDTDRSGKISDYELQKALSNGTWTPFNMQTVKLMISLFDKENTGQITFEQFGALWQYVVQWEACFRNFDKDRSGFIDATEFGFALRSFGFNLSGNIINLLIRRFDKFGRGTMYFDDFIRACVILNLVTTAFKEEDQDRDGVVTIHFEKFLAMVFSSVIV